jgi:ubiquinone/menaquinone biosynthesis C-methylase UbiE
MIEDPEQVYKSNLAFDLVAPYYDLLMESVPYRFWLKYLHTLWAHHKHTPQNVIDLACGTGTLSLLMAKEGMLVTGVDIAEKMLEQARKKSSEAGLYVEYVHQDAAELNLVSNEFDTVVSLFDSLNNITEPGKLRDCFVRVRRHLAPSGLFIFDVNTAYAFRQGMFDQKSIPSDGPLQYKWKSTYDEATQLCRVVMSFDYKSECGDRSQFEEVHVQRAYPTEEIRTMLDDAGFGPISVYDAYSLSPAKRRSDRIFFVAEAAK